MLISTGYAATAKTSLVTVVECRAGITLDQQYNSLHNDRLTGRLKRSLNALCMRTG